MTDGFGTLPFGTGPAIPVPFGVSGAVSLSSTQLRIDFTGVIDGEHGGNFNAVNYTIDGLTVLNVQVDASHSVVVETSTQEEGVLYTVLVNSTPGRIRVLDADFLDPVRSSATFGDVPATFVAAAQSRRKVRLHFSEPMAIDAAFIDPGNYQLVRTDGLVSTIASVEQTGPDDTRAQIVVSEDLVPFAYYRLHVSSLVRTQAGRVILPNQTVIQWKEVIPKAIRIQIAGFSGEVTGGLLGSPNGQVFLSPAFGTSSPNSVIEVDHISVCTNAFDVYTVPSAPSNARPLFTFPAPTGASALLGALGGVLWASAYRLGQAKMDLSDLRTESFAAPVDEAAEGLLVETIDITRASFLNDGRWRIFPGTEASLGVFKTAGNQTPIGPGPTIGPFSIP